MMRTLSVIVALAGTSFAAVIGQVQQGDAKFTIEIAPGQTRQVTEAEKWQLKAEGKSFMDITEFAELSAIAESNKAAVMRRAITYPSAMSQQTAVKVLLPKLDKTGMQSKLQTFSDFFNRYYKSSYGKQSSEWLLDQVKSIIDASSATNASVSAFAHTWTQSSVIAKIPGASTKTIVIGAHQDSINLNNPSSGRAPGAGKKLSPFCVFFALEGG
jgi:leucyl aminopeptidase